MGKRDLIKKASEYIFELYKTVPPGTYLYHDYTHLMDVADTCEEIAEGLKLPDTDVEIVTLAGWFHDAGYFRQIEDHEEVSAQIAETFLKKEFFPPEKIALIRNCILATKMPQSPQNLLEEIVCDADLSHIGRKTFSSRSDLLRLEFEQTQDKFFSDDEWLKKNLEFVSSYSFRTRYAIKEFENQRIDNYLRLHRRLKKREKSAKQTDTKKSLASEKSKLKKLKQEKPQRGIETMFRITSTNHIRLSSMADNKAHIMISINAIIISVVVTLLVRKLDANPHLIIPTLLLMTTSLLSIVFATMSTRPKITSGTFTKEDIRNKKANLLFFGNFFNMELDDFVWGMNEMMNDKDYLYGSMIKDFYFLGKVLGRKYKHMNICYNIFMIGMIISVLAYFVSILMYPTTANIDTLQLMFSK